MDPDEVISGIGLALIVFGAMTAVMALMFLDWDTDPAFELVGAGVAVAGLGGTLYSLNKKKE